MTSYDTASAILSTTNAVQSGGVTLLGGGPAYALRPSLERYRITWRFVAASLVPDSSLDSYRVAEGLRNALPSLGLIPVSPNSAVAGDPFVQFTIQVSQTAGLRTLADIIDAGNRLPVFSTEAGGVSLRLALDVSEIEVRASGLSTQIVAAQDYASRQRAFADATRNDIVTQAQQAAAAAAGAIGIGFTAVAGAARGAGEAAGRTLGETVKNFFGGLSDIVKFALGVAGIVGIAYVIVRYRK